MINLEHMILLERLNTLSKPLGVSYALLDNNKTIRLFTSEKGDTKEVCSGNAKTIKGVLKTLLNSLPNKYTTKDNMEVNQ